MPTIKTIKPLGLGDFTTLQSWEDWADDQATADQWAECYTGGSCGVVTLAFWTATPSATVYPKIYAADGEGHGGSFSAGAYIEGATSIYSTIKHLHVEGMRMKNTVSVGATIQLSAFSAAENGWPVTIEKNIIWTSNASNSTYCVSMLNDATNGSSETAVFRNNIVRHDGDFTDANVFGSSVFL